MSVSVQEAVQAANAAFERSDFVQAGHILVQLIQHFPKHPVFNYMLGVCYFQVGKNEDALTHLRRALDGEPRNIGYLNVLGSVLLKTGQIDEAVTVFNRLLEVDPSYEGAHNNLGVSYKILEQFDLAIHHYQKAVEINPKHGDAWNNLGIILSDVTIIEESLNAFRKAIESGNCQSKAWSNLLLNSNYSDSLSAQQIFDLHKEYGEQIKYVLNSDGSDQGVELVRKSSPLRIAYLSRDFRKHSVAFFAESLLKHHDRSRFEVICLYDDTQVDDITKRIQSYDLEFVGVKKLSDEQLASKVEELKIDVLVELGGHTQGNRMSLFQRRVAPVQMSWLGYPNTTGIEAMDYRVVDSYTDPEGVADGLMVEEPMRLERSFICYTGDEDLPSGRVSGDNDGVVFGSFNSLSKFSDTAIRLWARLLNACEGSCLVIKSGSLGSEYVRELLLKRFESAGLDRSRIDLKMQNASHNDHMCEYQHIDIALDTYPYHGTTTSFEALWMGVPVLSLCGDRHAARVGHSILSNIGLAEMSCSDEDTFVAQGKKLAEDRSRLNELRVNLREMLKNSSAGDAVRFSQDFEQALLSKIAS